MEIEIWSDIEGYNGLYQVSSTGAVKKLRQKYGKEKHISSFLARGYVTVHLHKNNKRGIFTIHRLVAKAFIPNTENKPCVNHINGIKTDNNINNLEWCTSSENHQHAFRTGLRASQKGEKNNAAKLTAIHAKTIRECFATGKYTKAWLGRIFSIKETTVRQIVTYQTWNYAN